MERGRRWRRREQGGSVDSGEVVRDEHLTRGQQYVVVESNNHSADVAAHGAKGSGIQQRRPQCGGMCKEFQASVAPPYGSGSRCTSTGAEVAAAGLGYSSVRAAAMGRRAGGTTPTPTPTTATDGVRESSAEPQHWDGQCSGGCASGCGNRLPCNTVGGICASQLAGVRTLSGAVRTQERPPWHIRWELRPTSTCALRSEIHHRTPHMAVTVRSPWGRETPVQSCCRGGATPPVYKQPNRLHLRTCRHQRCRCVDGVCRCCTCCASGDGAAIQTVDTAAIVSAWYAGSKHCSDGVGLHKGGSGAPAWEEKNVNKMCTESAVEWSKVREKC
uniref:Mediator of RNA polymerase II transcription subunit 12 n=1 Tax=Lygus hesperus TaxID=30085 RepID=A0A0A9YHJ3_LYGHE